MRTKLLAILMLLAALGVAAYDDINGNPNRKKLDLSETKAPKPNRFIDEPEAWFDHSTGMIYIYLDTSAYNEYTLYLTAPTGTSTVYPTTSVVAIPADSPTCSSTVRTWVPTKQRSASTPAPSEPLLLTKVATPQTSL